MVHGTFATAEVLDNIKATGYHYSTRAAMTVSIADMTVPPQKQQMLDEAQATVGKIAANYRRGLITDEERYRAVVDTWMETDKELTDVLLAGVRRPGRAGLAMRAGLPGPQLGNSEG